MVRLIVGIFVLITLLGCTKPYNAAEVACKDHCVKQWHRCAAVCDGTCRDCLEPANARADRNHLRFLHEQTVKGGYLSRMRKSYRDPLQCLKTTCNCHADYYQCTEACTGIIHKRLQTPLTCS